MKKLIKDWDELLPYEKVFRILTMVFAVATMAIAILSLCDADDMAIMEFCIGMTLLCQGVHLWRKQKGTAIFSLCTSVFILLVVIVLAFL